MFEIGQIVVLPGSAVSRVVQEIRPGTEENEYRLSYDENWYTEGQLAEAQEKVAQKEQWGGVLAPRRGRIVRHRLGRRDRYGW